jgi:predicted nucleotide-binding protein (sugar kinase/HSP70/actin superfamily)
MVNHWAETEPRPFTRDQRADTTIWIAGLSRYHDLFLCAAGRGRGYKMETLPVPDNASLALGKEFGNRGQCNPTYYTVGNLIKELQGIGVSRRRLLDDYVFVTAASCGPCRFGLYSTEYRKALKEAGFEGFRIVQLLQETVGSRDGHSDGLEFDAPFLLALLRAALAADMLNLMGYRIRPYERVAGATNIVLEQSAALVMTALEQRRSVLRALRQTRRLLASVEVDRLQVKPVVSVIGEFWAMTTEGDGNYNLHRFLEDEGAEILIQPLFNWLLYLVWERQRDLHLRMMLREEDAGVRGLQGKDPWRRLMLAKLAERGLKRMIGTFARAVGLEDWHLPDIHRIAASAHQHYSNDVRGGEAFLEVGKLMDMSKEHLAHLVVSVKPFGCMPSSSVSDGVQSLITARYPDVGFCAIETTGDGQSSAHSRVQMMLFKAHERARQEYDQALRAAGMSSVEAARRLERTKVFRSALHYPRHYRATTAANLVRELAANR